MRNSKRAALTGFVLACGMFLLPPVAFAKPPARAADASLSRCEAQVGRTQRSIDASDRDEAEENLRLAEQACAPSELLPDRQRLAVAQLNFGMLLYAQEPARALLHFRRAMKLDPGSARASLNVGGALITLKFYEEAVPILEAAIARGTDDRDTLFRLEFNAGFAFINLCVKDRHCDFERGEKHLQRAVELKPEFPDTYFQLAAIMNDRRHDSRRAMALFKQGCDRGHEESCIQYRHFKSHLDP